MPEEMSIPAATKDEPSVGLSLSTCSARNAERRPASLLSCVAGDHGHRRGRPDHSTGVVSRCAAVLPILWAQLLRIA